MREPTGPLAPLTDDPRFLVHALDLGGSTMRACGARDGRMTVRSEAIECVTCWNLVMGRTP